MLKVPQFYLHSNWKLKKIILSAAIAVPIPSSRILWLPINGGTILMKATPIAGKSRNVADWKYFDPMLFSAPCTIRFARPDEIAIAAVQFVNGVYSSDSRSSASWSSSVK